MTENQIKSAIRFATTNEQALKASQKAACYHCQAIYDANEVTDFLATERTALCPKCGIDSVIPSNSPIELTPENLKILNQYWF